MPATARTLKFTEEDLSSGSGAYAELDVPCDAPVRLADVLDYDKRGQGKSYGWIFRYMAETPSGNEVKFDTYLSFGENARWKLVQVLRAHGVELDDLVDLNPNELVGDELIGHIDFPRDDNGEPTSDYRELQEVFPISTPPFTEGEDAGDEPEPTDEDEPAIL